MAAEIAKEIVREHAERTAQEAREAADKDAEWRQARLGPGSYVDPTAQVLGWANISVGANTSIGEHCCINVNLRDRLRMSVGDNCFIARRNFFSTGDFIEIGDYCLTGPNCSFLNAGHVTDSAFVPYIVSGITSYGRLTIGTNCWLTTNVTVIGGVSIGYGSIVGANSLVMDSIPPLCMATGTPARIIKIFDQSTNSWRSLDDSGRSREEALTEHVARLDSEACYKAAMKQKYPTVPVPQVAAGRAAGEI